MKISVIIPVYKAERCIERCVRSLMEQTLQEGIEFLFVNDATPDDSIGILNRVLSDYPERRNQVRIIEHKENLGVTAARESGVLAATGEYIGWCDSDDWVENEMFEMMCEAAYRDCADIVMCDYFEESVNKKATPVRFHAVSSPHESVLRSLKGQHFSCTLWNQVFRTSLVRDNIKKIIPTNYGEDTFLVWHIYYHAKVISFTNMILYHYNQNNVESLVHKRDNSQTEWKRQSVNLKRLQHLYYSHGGWLRYHKVLNYLIFTRKYIFREGFDSPFRFFYTFRLSSLDIFFFPGMSLSNKMKIFMVNNCYPIYWLINHK